jgi:hypothetical protein
MVDFFPVTTGKLDMNAKWTSAANVPAKSIPNQAPKGATSTVGAMGDNAANNSGGTQAAFPGATSKVGATGDSAAKSGKRD